MAVASLVLGIIGLLISLKGYVLAFIGTIFGILAVVFAAVGLKKIPLKKGMCRAGLVLGIIAIVFGILMTAFSWILLLGVTSFSFNGINDMGGLEDFFDGMEDFFENIGPNNSFTL